MTELFKIIQNLDNPGDFDPWWMYVMKCGPYFKIGTSNDVNARRALLQSGNPFLVKIVQKKAMRKVFAVRFEFRVHRELRQFRHRGEWFHTDLRTIRTAIKICAPELRAWEKEYRDRTHCLEPYASEATEETYSTTDIRNLETCEVRAASELRQMREAKKAEMLQRLRKINGQS